MLRIYIIGIAILVVAIIANGAIVKLGLKSWYDFIELLTINGSSAFKILNVLDYLWLFIGYPLVLGLGYWIGDKVHELIIG